MVSGVWWWSNGSIFFINTSKQQIVKKLNRMRYNFSTIVTKHTMATNQASFLSFFTLVLHHSTMNSFWKWCNSQTNWKTLNVIQALHLDKNQHNIEPITKLIIEQSIINYLTNQSIITNGNLNNPHEVHLHVCNVKVCKAHKQNILVN